MSEITDLRLYDTILELSFDFERILSCRIKSFFYHFNKSSYKDKHVSPYFIVFIDTNNVKRSLLFNEIINTLHYVPTYSVNNDLKCEYNYVDISNRLFNVNKNTSIYASLVNYYLESNEDMSLVPIDKDIIKDVKDVLDSVDIKYKEDAKFIHVGANAEADEIIIIKHQKITSNDAKKYSNVIKPTNVDYYEDYLCIGKFGKHNDNLKSFDTSLALIAECKHCGEMMIYNYDHESKCCKCGRMNIPL